MSNGYVTAVSVEIGHSKTLLQILLFVHLLAAGIAFTLPFGSGWHMALLGLVALSAIHSLTQRNPGPIHRVDRDSQGRWRIATRQNDSMEAKLLPTTTVWDKLLVLRFRTKGQRLRTQSAVVMPDAMSAEKWRQLRRALQQRNTETRDQ